MLSICGNLSRGQMDTPGISLGVKPDPLNICSCMTPAELQMWRQAFSHPLRPAHYIHVSFSCNSTRLLSVYRISHPIPFISSCLGQWCNVAANLSSCQFYGRRCVHVLYRASVMDETVSMIGLVVTNACHRLTRTWWIHGSI